MNLYRLDYLNEDGTTAECVSSTALCGAVWLTRHSTAARERARALSHRGRPVMVTRISGGGNMRRMLVATMGRLSRA